jgi:hypothetical protein
MQALDDALLELVDDDARRRVLAWVNAKFLGPATAPVKQATPVPPPAGGAKRTTGKKTKGKAKVVYKQIKDLNLRPDGKESAHEFVEKKKPTNLRQKCVVALYYLLHVLELNKAGVGHVYTVFKNVEWPVPIDLLNTLHQAGSEGWLDTADSENLKITHIGENLVEHDLPKVKATP